MSVAFPAAVAYGYQHLSVLSACSMLYVGARIRQALPYTMLSAVEPAQAPGRSCTCIDRICPGMPTQIS